MGSKPKQQDYKPSASDVAASQQSYSDWQKFQTLYNPKLLELKAQADSGDVTKTLRGRANADAMQKLSQSSWTNANDTETAGLVSSGLTGALGQADTLGKKYQNDLGTSVLATRQGQAGVASQGLSALARMGTATALGAAENKMLVKNARTAAALKLGAAGVTFGANKLDPNGTGNFSKFMNAFQDNVAGQSRAGGG